MYKCCQLAAEHEEMELRAMNVKAVVLALEADLLDLEIKEAEGNPNTSKEELARLHADYDAHYVKALEELKIRRRTHAFSHIVGMESVSTPPADPSPVFVPSSSVRARLTDVGHSYASVVIRRGKYVFLFCRDSHINILRYRAPNCSLCPNDQVHPSL